MANVGTAPAGRTLIGAGNTSSPTFAQIGTNSGLTNHGVLLAQGNGAFVASAVGTAGQIFTSNGPGVDPTWQDQAITPNPFSNVYLVDDFLFSNNAGVTGDTGWDQSGTVQHTGEATHPGFIRIGQSGSAGYVAKDQTVTANGPLVLGAGLLTVEFLVRITSLSTHTYIVGLGIGPTSAEPTDGVYFLYASGTNSGAWVGKTANASTRSSANSANTVVANQWDRLKIIVNAAATSVSYFVNGVQIANSPLASNIPTANLYPTVSKSSGAGGGSIDLDLFTLNYVLTTPR